MSDLPRRSELPREPEYWEELAAKISADAARPLARYVAVDATDAAAGQPWYAVVAGRAAWLIAASAAAMLVLWLILPPRGSSVAVRWMQRSVSPNEAAGTLVSGAAPPSVDVLMIQFPPASLPQEEQR